MLVAGSLPQLRTVLFSSFQTYVLQEQGNLLQLVDPRLETHYSQKEAMKMINLALLCTNPSLTLRPPMPSIQLTKSFKRSRAEQTQKVTPQAMQEEFKMAVSRATRPFLTGRTDRFVNELELFLASCLTIDSFDRVYIEHLGWKIPETVEEGDVEEPVEHVPLVPYLYFFDEDFDRNELNSVF